MEQNQNSNPTKGNPPVSLPPQIPSIPQTPVAQAPVQVSTPHATTKSTVFLLLLLLGVTIIFSGEVLLNKKYQDELDSLEASYAGQSIIIPKVTPAKSSTMTPEQKDLEKINVGSVEADIQNIKTDLQGL